MVSIRISSLVLAAACLMATSQAAAVDMDSTTLIKRFGASRPYAPELYLRQNLEDADMSSSSSMIKRAVATPESSNTASWGALFKRQEESEEQLHARGLVSDEEIEKRGSCQADNECGSNHYCSTTRNRCYKKLNNWKKCTRDGACGSGYCCESSNQCEPPRVNGRNCHGKDNACDSGYCSVSSDKCQAQKPKGDQCRVDAGCKGSLSCVNGRCQNPSPSKPSKPEHHHPHHPSPSGSAQHPRSLVEA